MTVPPVQRRVSLAELALWSSAGIFAFAAHAGAVALMLQQPAEMAAADAPPAAIMIEMAPEPVAVNTEEDQIVPDEMDAEEIKTATTEPLPEPIVEPPPEPMPEPVVEPVVEPEPIPEPEPTPPEVVEPLPPEPLPEPVEEVDPIEEIMKAELENVEVPLPILRPPPPLPETKKEEVAEKQPPKKKTVTPPPPASKAAKQAKAQVQQSDRTAAAQNSAGAAQSSVSPARWQSRLMSHLERRKRYPSEAKANKEQGTAYVRFRIDDSGNVLSVSLSRSSGYASLDRAVIEMVQRASPVPAPPPGANKTITAPVKFNIR